MPRLVNVVCDVVCTISPKFVNLQILEIFVNQSIKQLINQAINQVPSNQPTNQPTNQSNKQTNKQTNNQSINQSINQKPVIKHDSLKSSATMLMWSCLAESPGQDIIWDYISISISFYNLTFRIGYPLALFLLHIILHVIWRETLLYTDRDTNISSFVNILCTKSRI